MLQARLLMLQVGTRGLQSFWLDHGEPRDIISNITNIVTIFLHQTEDLQWYLGEEMGLGLPNQ